jgi:predicted negative regulator of RcsB-dependent stress response
MAYDLEEQEELDVLKDWWKRNGNTALWALAVVFAAFAGFRGWQYYQRTQILEASAHYEALSQLEVTDIKSIRSLSGQLMEKYSGTAYASRAALLAAKANYEAKDANSAKAQLQWAMEHSREDQVRGEAQLQLAAILLEEKKYEPALSTLAAKHNPAFDGLFADLKGDILCAQGKLAEAKTAYKDALGKLDEKSRYRRYTEHKLDALGS